MQNSFNQIALHVPYETFDRWVGRAVPLALFCFDSQKAAPAEPSFLLGVMDERRTKYTKSALHSDSAARIRLNGLSRDESPARVPAQTKKPKACPQITFHQLPPRTRQTVQTAQERGPVAAAHHPVAAMTDHPARPTEAHQVGSPSPLPRKT